MTCLSLKVSPQDAYWCAASIKFHHAEQLFSFSKRKLGEGELCCYILSLNSNWAIIFYDLVLLFVNCKLFLTLTRWKMNIVDHDSLFDSSICCKIWSCGCNWLIDINIESKSSFLNAVCLWFVVIFLCHLLSIVSSFSL